MLKWIARHREAVNELQARVADRDRQIFELEARAERAEKTAHMLAEETRYTLESAAQLVSEGDPKTGETLANIAHVLPYVFSGRRHWDDPGYPKAVATALDTARATTREYGFELPDDPAEAVISLLELSSMLFVPSHSLPVDGLRIRHPVTSAIQAESKG